MLAVWSPKGGSGTSVTAAALSLALARRGGCRLVDLCGDQPALLGLASEPATGIADWLTMGPDAPAAALDRLTVEAAPGLALLPRGGPLPPAAPGAGHRLSLVLRGDAAATMGPGAAGPPPAVVEVGTAGAHPVVADLGTAVHPAVVEVGEAAGAVVAVVRPCYLALRGALAHPLLAATTGVVVVDEQGRNLRPADVARVLDRPVLAVVRAEVRVARAVDAGLLATRLPDCLSRMAMRVLPVLDVPYRDEAA